MGLGRSLLIHRRVKHNQKYGLWFVFDGEKSFIPLACNKKDMGKIADQIPVTFQSTVSKFLNANTKEN
jgi:hypothetical protein